MASSLEELEALARELPAEDRAKLADSLLRSLQAPPLADVEAAWSREIEARVAAFERGETAVHDAEDVFAAVRYLLK